jgi:hypothetical protein
MAGSVGQQLEEALGGAGGALEVAEHLAQAPRGAGHGGGEEHERGELAGAEPAGQDVAAADPKDQDDGPEHERDHDRGQHGPDQRVARGGGEGGVGAGREAGDLPLLLGEGLDGADGVERLLGDRAHLRGRVLRRAREAAHAAPDHDQRHHHERDHDQRHRGELRVGDQQEG